MLALHIEQRTLEREGKALTNFEQRLPRLQSDLARESLKDRVGAQYLGFWNNRALGAELGGHQTSPLLEVAAKRFGFHVPEAFGTLVLDP